MQLIRNRSLLRDTRGATGSSYVMTILLVAVVGIGGFQTLGGAMGKSLANDESGQGMAVSAQAGEGESIVVLSGQPGEGGPPPGTTTTTTLPSAQPGTEVNAGGNGNADNNANAGKGGNAGNGGNADEGGDDGCGMNPFCHIGNAAEWVGDTAQSGLDSLPKDGILGKVNNFVTNMGMNPLAWVADPLGQLQGMWNRTIGVGKFVGDMVWGIGSLVHKGNTLFNPLYPSFWLDLHDKGFDSFLDRRLGIGKEFLRIAPGVLKLGWRTSPLGLAWDLAMHPNEFLAHRREDWNSIAHNPLMAAIMDPLAKCAGAAGSDSAEQACGKVGADIALTIATAGWGKGAKAGSMADELADAGRIETKLDDVARGSEGADDAARCAGGACRRGSGACFTAGTPVTMGDTTQPIESVSAGSRVSTLAVGAAYATAVSSATHRLYEFEMANPEVPGSVIEIATIRPVGTYDEALVGTDRTVSLAFAEWGIAGEAQLTQVGAAPPISGGEGFVVLSTFRRQSDDVYSLSFEGSEETLEPTGTHRFWSLDRADWVATRDLREGERLRTATGEAVVETIAHLPGTHAVFNFEVEQEHTYLVGTLTVLTHNQCSLDPVEPQLPAYKLDEQGRPWTIDDRSKVLEHDVNQVLEADPNLRVLAAGDDAVRDLLKIPKNGPKEVRSAPDFVAKTDNGYLVADAKAGTIGDHGIDQLTSAAQKLVDEGHVTDPSQLDLRIIQQEGAKPPDVMPNGDLAPELRAPDVADNVLVRSGTDDLPTAPLMVEVTINGTKHQIQVTVDRIESTASKYVPTRR
jgi:Flp pilus assembly pilin Flp